MSRATWPLHHNRPNIELVLTQSQNSIAVNRRLLADTGAGRANAGFELLLKEQDCLICGGIPKGDVVLGGAYSGKFPVYSLRVVITTLGFDEAVPTVGVSSVPLGFDGIACFRFLNRFTYGNFADQGMFGLESTACAP